MSFEFDQLSAEISQEVKLLPEEKEYAQLLVQIFKKMQEKVALMASVNFSMPMNQEAFSLPEIDRWNWSTSIEMHKEHPGLRKEESQLSTELNDLLVRAAEAASVVKWDAPEVWKYVDSRYAQLKNNKNIKLI